MSARIYELVTERILTALRKGVVPWHQPWHTRPAPINAVSKHPYRGVNFFLLSLAEFLDHRWVTLKQACDLGGKVRRGERSTLVVFWKTWQPKAEETEETSRAIPLLRYYLVFNVEQCEGITIEPLPAPVEITETDRIEKAEVIVRGMPDAPRIEEHPHGACYYPRRDLVRLPALGAFSAVERYYATLFHELGHSTGHERRLGRPGIMERTHFGAEEYSREELIAELTSAFCCSAAGLDISLLEASAGYIDSWLKVLGEDPRAIVTAAGQAQRAADYILNVGGEQPP